MGPYASGSSVTITVVHNVNTLCNVVNNITFTCPLVVGTFPYCQTYDAANGFTLCNSTTSCTAVTCPLPAGQGWVNDNTESPAGDWYVLTGPSAGTANTGPGSGDNPNGPSTGAGQYLMIESGGCTSRTSPPHLACLRREQLRWTRTGHLLVAHVGRRDGNGHP